MTLTGAWQKYHEYLTDSRIGFALEPAGLTVQWQRYSQGNTFALNIWTDAYLAAFAKVGNYEIVTFDKGFSQYAGLSLTLLTCI